MTLGLANSTHAKVDGVDDIRILKLLSVEEAAITYLHPYWTLTQCEGGWVGTQSEGGIAISDVRDPAVLAPGNVIRLRSGASVVTVLWRRGARTNTLFATERCNSLCLMCSQPPRVVDDDWRVAEMLDIIPLVDKAEAHLGITGGEPTLLGDGLTKVLDACRRELPETKLHVLTNGRNFRMPNDAANWIAAGGQMTTWAVPLYADVPDIHDEVVVAPGAFDETLDGLYELARNGARVELRVVLHALTVPRLRQLSAFIYRRLPFVDHVALMGLEPMGFAKGNRDRLWIDPADYVDVLSDAVAFLANRSVNVSLYNLPLCVLPRHLWPFARQSISEWKNNFPQTCGPCVVKAHCAGFFASAGPAWRSRNIQTISLGDFTHAMA
ncbi:His-Xaa-Ser system radical SAM maturase HxsC [Asticcacaulis sp.]|uniref:His-Xaa-Ser system radical SAM maturase HxsC n=1 Tax=Asticcacaulis sp. TaxID=1872648 RepID=UPI002D1D9A4C|nr:His-Xaa-Ser system radical SAM maturase HxsC [Asticcacaulis sp.]HTM82170.1 His-Xaa-Ser system radical SAM maturase HxsC [Asticcacaulis sp.]